MAAEGSQWYFDPSTGEVSQGKQAGWENRMGPYASESEARSALEIAAARNKAADNEDDEDDDWGETPSWKK